MPSSGLAPGDYTVYALATDDGGATAMARAVVTLTNRPPVMAALVDRTTRPGQTITFTSQAADPDLGQLPTFSLAPGRGRDDRPQDGRLLVDPARRTALGTVTVRVTDDGSPRLSDARSFTVTVAAPFPTGRLAARLLRDGGATQADRRRARLQRTARRDDRIGRRSFQGHSTWSHAAFRPKVVRVRAASYDPASRSIRLTLASFDPGSR